MQTEMDYVKWPCHCYPSVGTVSGFNWTAGMKPATFWIMIAKAPMPEPARRGNRFPDLLENGAHLSASEFLRRYETMPEVKAELVNGIVYMASPVRLDQHGEPDSLIQGCLCNYAIATPGVKSATNSTARPGPADVPQPDGLLRLLPQCGGQARSDPKGYLQGAPEL